MPTSEINKLTEMLGQPRISEAEKGLLRNSFGYRYEMFVLLRNVLLGFELDETEKQIVKDFFSKTELRRVIRKIFLPELGKNIPLGYTPQNMDLWMTKEFEDLQSSDDKVWEKFVKTKDRFFEMMEQGLLRLENPDLKGVDISVRDKTFVDIRARNGYIAYVEKQSLVIATLAGSEEVIPAKVAEKINQNSSK